MTRPRLFFFGVLATLLLWVMGLIWRPVEIQEDLTTRAEEELARNGFHNVDLKFDGRDAYIDGNASQLVKMGNVVKDVYGVRVVKNIDDLSRSTAEVENLLDPSFSLSFEDGMAKATGEVEGLFGESQLEELLGDQFGVENVEIELGGNAIEMLSSLDNFGGILGEIVDKVKEPNVQLKRLSSQLMGLDVSGELKSSASESDLLEFIKTNTDSTLIVRTDFESVAAQRSLDNLVLNQRIAFLPGRAELRSSSRNLLNNIADSLARYPSVNVSIEGHTDAFGEAESNLLLSWNRANTVVDYLIGRNINQNRLEAKGFGETVPIASNKTNSGRRQNRRVEFRVSN